MRPFPPVTRLNLGPQWTPEEILVFFNEYKAAPDNIEKICVALNEKGSNRTIENVSSLIIKNKSYLLLPSASARDLSAIMSDYYESENGLHVHEEALNDADNENLLLKQPTAMIKTSKRLFSSIQNQYNYCYDSQTPSKVVKLKDNFLNKDIEKNDLLIKTNSLKHSNMKHMQEKNLNIMGKNFKNYRLLTGGRPFRKNSKVPKMGLQTYNPYLIIYDDLELMQDPKLASIVRDRQQKLSPYVKRWIRFEFFYSNIDKAYFSQNELLQCAANLKIHSNLLTEMEWAIIRKSFGKQRRFSKKFIQQERIKLIQFRETSQDLLYKGINENHSRPINLSQQEKLQVNETLIKNNVSQLYVTQRVLAIHPLRLELRTGSILTVDKNSFYVQYDNCELGVHKSKYSDIYPIQESTPTGKSMSSEYSSPNHLIKMIITQKKVEDKGLEIQPTFDNDFLINGVNEKLQHISIEQTLFNDESLYAMSSLINLLEIKNILVKQMKDINDKEKEENSNDFDKHLFGWLGILIQGIDRLIETAKSIFRVRVVKQISDDQNNTLNSNSSLPEIQYSEFPELLKNLDEIKSKKHFNLFLILAKLMKQYLEKGNESITESMITQVRELLSSSTSIDWLKLESLITKNERF